jgi:hypothetical protein
MLPPAANHIPEKQLVQAAGFSPVMPGDHVPVQMWFWLEERATPTVLHLQQPSRRARQDHSNL